MVRKEIKKRTETSNDAILPYRMFGREKDIDQSYMVFFHADSDPEI
jgi:hypothetical protein